MEYDGKTNPAEFLHVYITAMCAAGADDLVMANWLPMALKPNVRSWLMNLPKESVRSWQDLCNQFVGAFQGGFKRPGTKSDLKIHVQNPGESMRKYIQRFSQVQHTIPDIDVATMITTSQINAHTPRMRENMNVHDIRTLADLHRIADKCVRAQEGHGVPGKADPGVDTAEAGTSGGLGKKRKKNQKRTAVLVAVPGVQKPKDGGAADTVAAAERGGGP